MKKSLSILCIISILFLFGCSTGKESGIDTTAPSTAAAEAATYPAADKLIALTFDDGPNTHMSTIVDTLDAYDAKATFFVIGKHISGTNNKDAIQKAYTSGHEIGNHSTSHTRIDELTADEVISNIQQTQDLVEEITGEAPVWFRAPFLSANTTMYDVLDMPFAGSGVSAGDGSNDNLAEDRVYRVTTGAYDGAIVLLHCNDITAEVLPEILEYLKQQGYEMVTISELFSRNGITPDINATFQYKNVNGD